MDVRSDSNVHSILLTGGNQTTITWNGDSDASWQCFGDSGHTDHKNGQRHRGKPPTVSRLRYSLVCRKQFPAIALRSFNPGIATASDNCPGATVNGVRSDFMSLNSPYPVGTTTITWTATDASWQRFSDIGNSDHNRQ
jgi:hypothetical protein